ncbi:MAG: type II secretion system minor pseudopilin GspK [Hyphomonas sp.]|nr:type II secretion system minor pseudopilin GspK [Hyphomonas sp.]
MTRQDTSEDGTTLLATLFVVMVMSIAAAAGVTAVTESIRAAKVSQDGMRTEWLARSAARGLEAIIVRQGSLVAQAGSDPIPVPLPQGTALVSLHDTTSCFNLNSLALDKDGTEIDPQAVAAYRRLLTGLGATEGEADRLAATLSDWIDADGASRNSGAEESAYSYLASPYRAANHTLRDISELRSIDGYSAEIVAQVTPSVCVREPATLSAINLNSLTEQDLPLLQALALEDVSMTDLAARVGARPSTGWVSVEEFLSVFAAGDGSAAPIFAAELLLESRNIRADFALPGPAGPVVFVADYEKIGEGGWHLVSLRRTNGHD